MRPFWDVRRMPLAAPVAEHPGSSATIQGLHLLIAELSGEIQAYTSLADKYFALAGSLLIGSLGVLASAQGQRFVTGVAIAAPFGLIAILHYVTQLLTEKAARIGMKRAAEDKVRELDPAGRFSTTLVLARSVGQRRPSVLLSMVVYVMAAVAAIVLCVHAIASSKLSSQSALIAAILGALALLVATAVTAIVELALAEKRAYRDSSRGMEPRDP